MTKEQTRLYNIAYRTKNKNKIKAQRKEYRAANADVLAEYGKTYRKENKDKISNLRKNHYRKNITKEKLNNKAYYNKHEAEYKNKRKTYKTKNSDKINTRTANYRKLKRKTDELYWLTTKIRTAIRQSLIRYGFTKNSLTADILGCPFEQFKQHIEGQFETWMNWANRGLYNGTANYGWDVDHIKPLASVKTEEEIIKLNHYTNLRPLCSHVNRDIKRDKY